MVPDRLRGLPPSAYNGSVSRSNYNGSDSRRVANVSPNSAAHAAVRPDCVSNRAVTDMVRGQQPAGLPALPQQSGAVPLRVLRAQLQGHV